MGRLELTIYPAQTSLVGVLSELGNTRVYGVLYSVNSLVHNYYITRVLVPIKISQNLQIDEGGRGIKHNEVVVGTQSVLVL